MMIDGLPWCSYQQINIDIFKTALFRELESVQRHLPVMNSRQELQFFIIKRLYSNAESVDPQISEFFQFDFINRSRITFKSYLGVLIYIECGVDSI